MKWSLFELILVLKQCVCYVSLIKSCFIFHILMAIEVYQHIKSK